MYKILFSGFLVLVIVSCNPEANRIPPCFNGVQDGNETGLDCGGPDCEPCEITCIDKLLNGEEEGVDCGGSTCELCDPKITLFKADVDGVPFDSTANDVALVSKVFSVSGTANNSVVNILFAADINPGTYEIPLSGVVGSFSNGTVVPPLFFTSDSGSLTINTHDKVNKIITGDFQFNGTASGGETVAISNGSFRITY